MWDYRNVFKSTFFYFHKTNIFLNLLLFIYKRFINKFHLNFFCCPRKTSKKMNSQNFIVFQLFSIDYDKKGILWISSLPIIFLS